MLKLLCDQCDLWILFYATDPPPFPSKIVLLPCTVGWSDLKNKKLHILCCAKLLSDLNSKMSECCIFTCRRASENLDFNPKMSKKYFLKKNIFKRCT